jgi:hypothetical protein
MRQKFGWAGEWDDAVFLKPNYKYVYNDVWVTDSNTSIVASKAASKGHHSRPGSPSSPANGGKSSHPASTGSKKKIPAGDEPKMLFDNQKNFGSGSSG